MQNPAMLPFVEPSTSESFAVAAGEQSNDSNEYPQYNDRDISLLLDIKIKAKGGYVEDGQYLLAGISDGKYPDEDSHQYWVLVTPAIATFNEQQPIDYFFDKAKQPRNILALSLEEILPELSALKSMRQDKETLITALESILKNFFSENDRGDTVKTVYETLIDCQFDENKIKSRIAEKDENNLRKDIFDEIREKISSPGELHIKLLFPYNSSQKHWLTGEIKIHRVLDHEYIIDLTAHDPFGRGNILPNNFEMLRQVLQDKIAYLDYKAIFDFRSKESSYLTPRQNKYDRDSCGVIIVEDLLKRIDGQRLTQENPYPHGARILRADHFRLIKDHSSNTNDAIDDFVRRHGLMGDVRQPDAPPVSKITAVKVRVFPSKTFSGLNLFYTSNEVNSFYRAVLPDIQTEILSLRKLMSENNTPQRLVEIKIALNEAAAIKLLEDLKKGAYLLDVLLLRNKVAIELDTHWTTRYESIAKAQLSRNSAIKYKEISKRIPIDDIKPDSISMLALMHALKRKIVLVDEDGRVTNRKDFEKLPGDPIFVFHNNEGYGSTTLQKDSEGKDVLTKLLAVTWGDWLRSITTISASGAMLGGGIIVSTPLAPVVIPASAAAAVIAASLQALIYAATTDSRDISMIQAAIQSLIGAVTAMATAGFGTATNIVIGPIDTPITAIRCGALSGLFSQLVSYITSGVLNRRFSELNEEEFIASALTGALAPFIAGGLAEAKPLVKAALKSALPSGFIKTVTESIILSRGGEIFINGAVGAINGATTRVLTNVAGNVARRDEWNDNWHNGVKSSACNGALNAMANTVVDQITKDSEDQKKITDSIKADENKIPGNTEEQTNESTASTDDNQLPENSEQQTKENDSVTADANQFVEEKTPVGVPQAVAPIYKPKLINADTLIMNGENIIRSQDHKPFHPNPTSNGAFSTAYLLAEHRWGKNKAFWDKSLIDKWARDIQNYMGKGKSGERERHTYVANVITSSMAASSMPAIIQQFDAGASFSPQIKAELKDLTHHDAVATVVVAEFEKSLAANGGTPLTVDQRFSLYSGVAASVEGPTCRREARIIENMERFIPTHVPAEKVNLMKAESKRIEQKSGSVTKGEFYNTSPAEQLDIPNNHRRTTVFLRDRWDDVKHSEAAREGVGAGAQIDGRNARGTLGTARDPYKIVAASVDLQKPPSTPSSKRPVEQNSSDSAGKVPRINQESHDISDAKIVKSDETTQNNKPIIATMLCPALNENSIMTPHHLPEPELTFTFKKAGTLSNAQ